MNKKMILVALSGSLAAIAAVACSSSSTPATRTPTADAGDDGSTSSSSSSSSSSGSGSSSGTPDSGPPACTGKSDCTGTQLCCATLSGAMLSAACQAGPCVAIMGFDSQVCNTPTECVTAGHVCLPVSALAASAGGKGESCQPPLTDAGGDAAPTDSGNSPDAAPGDAAADH